MLTSSLDLKGNQLSFDQFYLPLKCLSDHENEWAGLWETGLWVTVNCIQTTEDASLASPHSSLDLQRNAQFYVTFAFLLSFARSAIK